jgi:hypothetical protein
MLRPFYSLTTYPVTLKDIKNSAEVDENMELKNRQLNQVD